MAQPIKLEIDAYGNYARVSAVADYLELAALAGLQMTRNTLADNLADAQKLNPMLVSGDEHEEKEEEEEEEDATSDGPGVTHAERVFDLLDERLEALGDDYPFQFTEEDELSPREGMDAVGSMYIALLALTVAHAFKIDARPHDPKQVLEDTVARSLGSAGLAWVNVGAVSRDSADFRDTILTVGEAVRLRASPLAARTYRFANEEGVDCLGHLPMAAPRAGGSWVFLGQVTCGSSESWDAKLDEPKPLLWRQLLNTGVSPQAFLAVPHHAEPAHLAKLVLDSDRVVLDRLRLVPLAGFPSEAEATIRKKVLEVGVEKLA